MEESLMYRPKSFTPIGTATKGFSSGGSGYTPKSFTPEKKTLGGFAQNVASSGGRFIGDIAKAVTSPIQTGKSLIGLGAGLAQKLIPGRQEQEKYADQIGKFYKQRYGGAKNIVNTLYYDPVGALGDVSAVAGGTGAALKVAGKGSKLAKIGSKLSKLDRATDPLQIVGKAAKSISKPVRNIARKADVPKSGDILTRGLGNPAKQRKMITPMEELIPKHNLYARTPEVAQKALDVVGEQRKIAVKQSGAFGGLQDLIKPLDDEILSIKSNPNLFRGDIPLSPEAGKRLSQLTENRNNIVRRFAKTEDSVTNLNPKVDVAEIDAFRRESIDPNIPKGSFAKSMSQRPAKDKAFQQTRKALSKAVDKKAGTQSLGREMQSLMKAKDVFEGYQTRGKNRQIFNFSKMGSAGIGGMISGIPGAVGGFAVEQFVNSPKGMEIMYKTLKSLENKPFSKVLTKSQSISKLSTALSKAGVPKASEVARYMYNYARAGRMTK